MRTRILILTLAALVALSSSGMAAHFSIDSVQAQPGDHFGVKVRLHENSFAFSTMFVPVQYDNSLLTLDSVSFEGSMKPNDFTGFDFNYTDLGIAQFTYVPPFGTNIPTIGASEGIAAELFFTLSDQATTGFLPIDSVSIDSTFILTDTIHVWTRITMSDNTGSVFVAPDCIAGGVEVMVPTDVNDGPDDANLPTEFALSQNYPNPFNPTTTIEYSLPEAASVKLEVFNVLGQLVTTLVDGRMSAGVHTAEFDGTNRTSGIYFYRLTHDGFSDTKKMVMVK